MRACSSLGKYTIAGLSRGVHPCDHSHRFPTDTACRSIVLDLECADTTGFFPMYDIVEEDVFCGYHAVIKTFAACPRECPRGGPSSVVCSNNGICGYDQTAGKAKCFCNKGWSGPDCLTQGDKGLPPPPSYAGNIAGGFFGGLFGGLAAAVGFFMVKSKVRRFVWAWQLQPQV